MRSPLRLVRLQCSAVYIALVEIDMARDIYIKHSCIAHMELKPSSRHIEFNQTASPVIQLYSILS